MQGQIRQIEAQITNRELKKADIAIARLLRAELTTKDYETLRILRARVRLLTARPDDALDDLSAVSKLDTEQNPPPILELFGDIYFARFEVASVGFADRFNTEQAKRVYNRLIEEYPNYDNLGWIYYQMGRIALTENTVSYAKECFQNALLNPTRIRALTAYCYERLGYVAHYEERDLTKARDFLDRAVNTFPQNEDSHWLVQVHILRTRVYKGIGDDDAAIRAAEIALNIAVKLGASDKRSHSEALLNMAELLSEIKNRDQDTIVYLQEFIHATKRPLGIDVTWSRVNEMLGNAHFNLGHYEAAAMSYAEALQFNPDHPWSFSLYHRMARCQYHKHSYYAVVEIVGELLKRATSEDQIIEDYRIYDLLGNAHFALQKYGEAAAAYKTALKMAPPNVGYADQIQPYLDMARELT